MRVYISCHDKNEANAVARVLLLAGHEVVSTWHAEPGDPPDRDDAAAWKQMADANLSAIATRAEVLALVAGPDRYPGGKFLEAGYALARGVRVVTVGRVENGMLWADGLQHVADADGLAAVLTVTP